MEDLNKEAQAPAETKLRKAHFTFRTQRMKGKEKVKRMSRGKVKWVPKDVEKDYDCLYVKFPGRPWKMFRAFEMDKRPQIEEIEALLMSIATAENLFFTAVTGIPSKIGLTEECSFTLRMEAAPDTEPSLMESYALELVNPKELWEAFCFPANESEPGVFFVNLNFNPIGARFEDTAPS
jgi:hypothetical protein